MASLTLRAYTGANAAVESVAQTALTLCATDALSGPSVAPGSVSYERWLRLRVDSATSQTVTRFAVQTTPALPDGVTIKYGVSDTAVTPKNTVSTIATHTLGSDRIIWDMGEYDADGDHTRYLVLQMVVASSATSGAIPQNSLKFSWLTS